MATKSEDWFGGTQETAAGRNCLREPTVTKSEAWFCGVALLPPKELKSYFSPRKTMDDGVARLLQNIFLRGRPGSVAVNLVNLHYCCTGGFPIISKDSRG